MNETYMAKFREIQPAIFTLLPGLLVAFPSVVAGNTQVESFQNFLTNRPIVSQVTFTRRLLHGAPEHLEKKLFIGRWQPNGSLIHYLSDVDSAEPARPVIWGFNSGTYFTATRDDIRLYPAEELEKAAPTNPYRTLATGSHGGMVRILNSALSLGLDNFRDGSLSWSGTNFTAETLQGQRVSGTIEVDGGRVRALKYLIPGTGNHVVYDYEYKHRLEVAFLPSLIRRVDHRNDVGIATPVVEVEILQISTSEKPIDPSYFDPATYVNEERGRTFLFEDGHLYMKDPFQSNRLERVFTASEIRRMRAPPDRRSTKLLLSVLVIAGLILPVFWAVGRKRRIQR